MTKVFGVNTVNQRYVSLMGACMYTGKTPDQLSHAVRKGLLKQLIARDGSKSFEIVDLDGFMTGSEMPK